MCPAMYRTVHGSARTLYFVLLYFFMKLKFYYVYILLSKKDHKFYVGFTEDLVQRFRLHNDGKVNSTKSRRPLELIFYEAYKNKYDALRREKYFKTSKGKTTIQSMLKEFLLNRV